MTIGIDKDTAQHLAENGLNIRGEKQEEAKMSDPKRQEAINCLEGIRDDLEEQRRAFGSSFQGSTEEMRSRWRKFEELNRDIRDIEKQISELHLEPRDSWEIDGDCYTHEDGIYAVSVYDLEAGRAELLTRGYCKYTHTHEFAPARNPFNGSTEEVLREAERRNAYIQKKEGLA